MNLEVKYRGEDYGDQKKGICLEECREKECGMQEDHERESRSLRATVCVSPPSLPTLGELPPFVKLRLPRSPSRLRASLVPPPPGVALVGPASPEPAQLLCGPRQGAQRNPPAARRDSVAHTPLRPARLQFRADYASAPSPPGCAGSDSERGLGSLMAAPGSRRPNV
ncbi:hypothetical protein MC885_014985 [Smutsia gigantea]|nr:hypothetical protein MC885_014985 [Smutsia gigantea]